MSKRYLEIRPESNPSSQLWSPNFGSPQCTFNIGAQNTFLIGHTVRISGYLRFKKDLVDNPASADTINANSRIGIYNVLDQLIIKNGARKGGSTLEHIRNYHRMCSSLVSLNSGLQEGLSHLNSTCLQMPNYETFREGVVNNSVSADDGVPFCCHLPCGILSQRRIPLSSQAGLGGLSITLMLSPSSAVVYSDDGATSISDAFYQLKDLRLTCEVYVPSVDELSQMMKQTQGAMQYNSISSQLASINTRNGIINFSLGLSRVKSIFINSIQSKALNNRLFDSMTTGDFINLNATVAKTEKQINTRGGLKYPRDFDISTVVNDEPNYLLSDPQIIRNYSNAVAKWVNLTPENYVSPMTCNFDYTGATTSIARNAVGGYVQGFGCVYDDHVGTTGQSFKDDDFGLEVTSKLNTDNPQTLFLFAVNENILMFNSVGVQVQN